jgi:hypothetical protein
MAQARYSLEKLVEMLRQALPDLEIEAAIEKAILIRREYHRANKSEDRNQERNARLRHEIGVSPEVFYQLLETYQKNSGPPRSQKFRRRPPK